MEDPEILGPKKTNLQLAAELIRAVVLVLALAFVVRLFLFEPYSVDGASMYPYLHNTDRLEVEKISYHFRAPHRGDVIVFKFPNDLTQLFVKRVIGLPGEKVTIKDDHVIITNQAHPDGVMLTEPYLAEGIHTTLLSGKTDIFQVPNGQYFVMGDNRPASSDSREWGYLPREDIIGRAAAVASPLDRFMLVPGHDYGF